MLRNFSQKNKSNAHRHFEFSNRDTTKDKKTINSLRNEQQKAKSRVAAQTRRKNENESIDILKLIVPWIPENPPDKSTIIRLSTSYIGLLKVLNESNNGRMIGM